MYLAENVAGMASQMKRFLDFDGSNAAVLVNNYDWMSGWSYINFLRDVGKNFSDQRDARQGLCEKQTPARRQRHELHRVQLHAAASIRFRLFEQAPWLHVADRWKRSVGEHNRWHRSRAAHAWPAVVWTNLSVAAYQ